MKERLANNLNLKIIAVLFSVALWVISININDPLQSKTYSVTVQLQNMSAMTNAGKYVEILDDSDEISVTVRANRSIMDNFSASNIMATADMREVDDNNQVPIRLATTRVSGNKVESVRSESEYLYLKVEDVKRIQKRIEVNVNNEPAEGYILGRTSTEQNALNISGPESLVSEVVRAVVSMDLTGATEDVSMLLPIEMYDADGVRIIDSRLTASINEVQCVATILETKEVPLNYTVNGIPQEGFGWTGEIKPAPASVLIAGKGSVLRNVNAIEIPDALDLTDASANVSTVVNLRDYLAEGIYLADSSFSGRVSVTAFIEKEVLKTVDMDSRRLQLIQVPEGMEGKIVELEETIPVVFKALESAMGDLNIQELQGYLDLKHFMEEEGMATLEEGTYMVPVEFDIPTSIGLAEEIVVEVEITSAQ